MDKESSSSSEEDRYVHHVACDSSECMRCRCEYCGIKRIECECERDTKPALLERRCRDCKKEYVLGDLFNGFLVKQSRLGHHEWSIPVYMSLCRNCYTTRKLAGDEYMENGEQWKKRLESTEKENAYMKTEMAKLTEANAALSRDTADEMAKMRENYFDLQESYAKLAEHVMKTDGELKRKRLGEDNIVDTKSVDDMATDNETTIRECCECKTTKPLSTFKEKLIKKNKEGKSIEYKTIRSMCRSCRNAKYKNTKKAKTT